MLKIDKSLITLLVVSTLVCANEQEVKVFANSVINHKDSNITNIEGGVVIEYDGDLLSGKSAIYDKNKNQIVVKNSVTYIQKSGKSIKANELIVNLENNNIVFKDFFQIDQEHVWITSTNAKKSGNKIDLQNALFSSCQIDNPDWLVGFDKAIYNLNNKELKLYDAKVYIKDIPVFYFPYIYLPLSKERRSGLLKPTFAKIDDEGYLYEQPYFWAINQSQDLEINPQIRTKRGYGIYATYRFFTSKDAYGILKAGYFKDKKSYAKKYNLKYKEHYGLELKYQNNSLIDSLSKGEYENKLYINGLYFTDSDYINLQNSGKIGHHKIGSYFESRMNYFIKNNYFYTGIVLRHFKSDYKDKNDKTLQLLPKIDIHIPYGNIFSNNVSSMADLTVTNYVRKNGIELLKTKIEVPLDFHYSLFNNYLNLNISEDLETTHYSFRHIDSKQKDYTSVVLNHKIELSTDVSKAYSSGIHTAFYGLIFSKSSLLSEDGMKYKTIAPELKSEFIDKVSTDSRLTFRTHHYWYSYNNKLDINYILEAYYSFREKKIKGINQDLSLRYEHFNFYSNLNYYNRVLSIYSKILYRRSKYGIGLSYLWEKDYKASQILKKDLSVYGYYNYDKNLSFSAKVNYDLKDKYLKKWLVSSSLNRKCWSIDFTFGQDIRPVVRSDGSSSSIKNNFIGVQLTILPFGITYAGGN